MPIDSLDQAPAGLHTRMRPFIVRRATRYRLPPALHRDAFATGISMKRASPHAKSSHGLRHRVGARLRDPSIWECLGPGLVTGAADDDPSGIATYSQTGARFGFATLWTLWLTYPLMVAMQYVSALIGRVTGEGLAANIRKHYPKPVLYGIVLLLFIANTINLGADIGAMGQAVTLIVGGPPFIWTVADPSDHAHVPVVRTHPEISDAFAIRVCGRSVSDPRAVGRSIDITGDAESGIVARLLDGDRRHFRYDD